MDTNRHNSSVVQSEIVARANIGKNVIYFSLATVGILGLVAIISAVLIHGPDIAIAEKKFCMIRDTFTMLLPVLGTWVGTVLAFYFSRENFAEAAKQTAAIVKHFTPEQQLEKVLVTDAMISLGDMNASKLILTKTEDQIKLWDDIIDNIFNKFSKNRLPILDENGCVKYIVHRSIMDKFIAEKALMGGTKNVKDFTLKDLMDSNDNQNIATAFGVVGHTMTLASVKKQMDEIPNCSDVFVTNDGTKNSKAIGWITNVIVTEKAKV